MILLSPAAGLSAAITPQSGFGFNQRLSTDGMSRLHGGNVDIETLFFYCNFNHTQSSDVSEKFSLKSFRS